MNEITLEQQAAAMRFAIERALTYLRQGDARTAEAWLSEALQSNAGRELVRWCTAIGGALGVAHERVQMLERGEWPP